MLTVEEQAAVDSAKLLHPGVYIDSSLFRAAVVKTREKYSRMPFVEARRYALNECHIWEKEKRKAFNSALGILFGARGGRKTASRKPGKRQGALANYISLEKGGQYKFDI